VTCQSRYDVVGAGMTLDEAVERAMS